MLVLAPETRIPPPPETPMATPETPMAPPARCASCCASKGNQGRPLLAARNPRRQPMNQRRHHGVERRSKLLLHLLLNKIRNPRHLCLEFFNLARLAFRAGLVLLPHTS